MIGNASSTIESNVVVDQGPVEVSFLASALSGPFCMVVVESDGSAVAVISASISLNIANAMSQLC